MNDYTFCPVCGNKLENGAVEGKERLQCSSDRCEYVYWDNPVPVVAGIVEYEGRILLSRNRNWPEKRFALTTGFLEKDETPEEGIIREIKEELDLDAEIIDFIGLYSFSMMNQLLIVYFVSAKGSITLNDEIAEVKHVPFEEVKAWPIGTGPAVSDWIDKYVKREE